MTEQQYTAEPWLYQKITSCFQIRAEGGMGHAWTETDDAECEANARRIVACVNVCKGMTTEDLEFAMSHGNDASRLGVLCNLAYDGAHKKFAS